MGITEGFFSMVAAQAATNRHRPKVVNTTLWVCPIDARHTINSTIADVAHGILASTTNASFVDWEIASGLDVQRTGITITTKMRE